MSEINSNNAAHHEENGTMTHKEASWLLAVTFTGLGTGFILLILTLSMVYSAILCATGLLVVWPLARTVKGTDFAMQASFIYFASAIVGIAVGWGATFGTGLPVVAIF